MQKDIRKKTSDIQIFTADTATKCALPFADSGISAGFPSPAQDITDSSLDLNKELISNPLSTFLGYVRGESMKDAGVLEGDILVIDKSLTPQDGDMAVCFIDGEFTLKFIRMEKEALCLVPANPAFKPIRITEDNHFCIWGIVTYTIRKQKQRSGK